MEGRNASGEVGGLLGDIRQPTRLFGRSVALALAISCIDTPWPSQQSVGHQCSTCLGTTLVFHTPLQNSWLLTLVSTYSWTYSQGATRHTLRICF